MKKNLIALLLALAMTLSLAACGGNDDAAEETTTDTTTEETTDQVETDAEDVVTELPETDPEADTPAAPVEDPETTPSMPEVTPEVTPTVKPETKPEGNTQPEQTTGPMTPAAGSVDLNAFYESVAASQGENWPMMMLAEGEFLDAFFPGLSAVNTKQCYPYTPAMTGMAAEIVLVEAATAEDAAAAKAALQARIDYQTSPDAMLYPSTAEVWQNNSYLVSNGNYIMLVAHSNAADIVASFNALFA